MVKPPLTLPTNATVPVIPGAVALLLLAAGASSRMGRPKQLLPYQGRTLLRHAAETAVAAGCTPIILITGALHQELVAEISDLPIQVVHNPDWASGMASSIRVGLGALPAAPTAVLFMLTDQPLVTPALLRQLVAQQQQTLAPIVAAAYGDTLGVPAIFDYSLLPELWQLQGAQGANRLIAHWSATVDRVPFPAGLLDIDTPEQYQALLNPPPESPIPQS